MSSESKRTAEELIFFDRVRKASEEYVNEKLLAEESVAWNTSKTSIQLRDEIAKMSEKKAKELFSTEEERQVWIESIRKSVELNLQSQVRAFLGTPPNVKRKRLREQKLGEEQRIQSNSKQNRTNDTNYRSRNTSKIDGNEESFSSKRNPLTKKYDLKSLSRMQKKNGEEEDLDFDPLSDEFNKHFSPYTRAALENAGNRVSEQSREPKPYKRAPGSVWVDSQGRSHEIAGPYWPKDHLPLYSNQKHLEEVPDFTEPLNSSAEKNITKEEENSLFPKPWRGTMTVYERRSNTKFCPSAPTGCFPNLKFESRFECGNLQQAKRIGRCEYDLILTTDLYTRRHTQWYYFRVENMIPGVSYKFNIINLLKRDSLYNYGMKPLLYSQKLAGENNIGWKRTGHTISYSRNTSHKDHLLGKELAYYVLSFKVEFPRAADVCYLAHCYPYSYSDLELYLRTLVDSPATSQHLRKEILCKTLAGNNCYVLTITSSQVPDHQKSGVVISARVHPGETNASWMMKGVLDYLTSSGNIAESLRRKFVFKIVPMLNPDGVIVGNYRTNLAAKDLNRTYKEPDKDNFPTVWHIKKMLESFREIHEVSIYCDLHGHSRKPNVFMYGCTEDPKMGSVANFLEERLFPWMMSQRAPDKFSFQGCKFIVRKCKESTARVVMWRQLGITNSFTMEATFCGANFGDLEKGRHFNTRDFEDMGRHFCEVLMEYSEAKSTNRKEMTQSFVELSCKMTRDILRQSLGNFKRVNNNNSNTKIAATTAQNEQDRDTIAGRSAVPGIRLTPRLKDVNYVDVDIKTAQGVGNPSGKDPDYEVSVKSIHVDSFNDCIKILEGLNLNECYEESDSSDSDSEPEEEESLKKDVTNEMKRKKKKKKRKQTWWESLSKNVPENKEKITEEEKFETENSKKIKTNFGKFINPYTNRFNNGIPTYSQERIMERAKKKELEKEAAAEEKDKKESEYPLDHSSDGSNKAMIAFTNTTELNFVTAQRRLTYYMMNRGQHNNNKQNDYVRSISHPNLTILPSKPDIPNVDSVKVDYLDGGGYGFAIRFPTKKHQETEKSAEQSGRKSQRQVSLQSFEEARSSADEIETPSFVEVHARSMSPFGEIRRQWQQPRKSNEIPAHSNKESSTKPLKDLETMLRLVNTSQHRKTSEHFMEYDYHDELLAEFNKLNMRTRRHDFRRTRNQVSHHKGPSVNNRSTVELRTPIFSSFDESYSDSSSRSSDKKYSSISPEYEPYTSAIPSYSSVGNVSPQNTRKTYR